MLEFPGALTSDGFLRSIWQQQPLLMRQAIVGYQCPLQAEELAGLACEDTIESRLIVENSPEHWILKNGPFGEADFAALPPSHWTLLVQDVDKHVPEVASLLDEFRFIPRWRMDDVMISYAEDGGSVGPHIDQYDVFLFQASGRRRWAINPDIPTNAPVREDTSLRILSEFHAQRQWTLEPGDILYLPPGVAHWGIAQGPCITCSVGFRAPSWRELFADWSDYLMQRIPEDANYRDPRLPALAFSDEIPEPVFAEVAKQLELLRHADREEMKRWFGRFVSEAKPQFEPPMPSSQMTDEAFVEWFRINGVLQLHPYLRTALTQITAERWILFANGREFLVPPVCFGMLKTFTETPELRFESFRPWLNRTDCREFLVDLCNLGYLEVPDD